MARNSTERLVVIWSREDPLFPVQRQHGDKESTPQASTDVVLCCFREWCFLRVFSCYITVSFLANCSTFVQTSI